MYNINWIKVPLPEAVETFGFFDNFIYFINITGFYNQIPQANDNLDSYITGGGRFTQIFLSGSGNWINSGYTQIFQSYLSDDFENYQTGFISGFGVTGNGLSGFMKNETGLSSGISVIQYTIKNYSLTGYTIWSGYI